MRSHFRDIEMPEMIAGIWLKDASGESSQIIAARVATARQFVVFRNQGIMCVNAHIDIDQ